VPEYAETGDEPEVNPAAPPSTNEAPELSVPVTAPPGEAQSATAWDPEPTEEPPGDATAQCVEAMTDEDLTDEQRNELEDWANLNCEALVLINENIAAGYSTIQNVIDGWIDSEGHCRNLRSASITHFGIAMAANDTSDYFRYWTFNSGRK
jgi:hypothetical protein